MDLLVMMLLVLPLVLTGAEVQTVTEVRGKLGQDVSLNCSIGDTDVYWSMEILRQFRLSIGYTYFPTEKASYDLPEFKTKYLIKGNILVITNMSSEDVRLYYCGRRINNSINVEDTFLLVSDVSLTRPNVQQQQLVIIASSTATILGVLSVLSVLLVLLVLGWDAALSCLRRKHGHRPLDDLRPSVWQTVQYEVIQSQ